MASKSRLSAKAKRLLDQFDTTAGEHYYNMYSEFADGDTEAIELAYLAAREALEQHIISLQNEIRKVLSRRKDS